MGQISHLQRRGNKPPEPERAKAQDTEPDFLAEYRIGQDGRAFEVDQETRMSDPGERDPAV
jgi:hypothetical protein